MRLTRARLDLAYHRIARPQSRRVCRMGRYYFIGLFTSGMLFCAITILQFIITEVSRRDQHVSAREKNLITQYRMFPRGGDELKFDQPWSISHVRIYQSVQELDSTKRYIFGNFSYSSGLGNLMFQYAALRAYAESWNASVALPADSLLRRAFAGFDHRLVVMNASGVDDVLRRAGADYPLYEFQVCCRYEPLPTNPFADIDSIIVLNGYFQSFRYFHPVHEELIRAEFTFFSQIQERAQRILIKAKRQRLDEMAKANKTISELTFIGVHVRHGMDVTLHARNLRHGHSTAPASYFVRALNDYRRRYGTLVVIVVSDSVHWARTHIIGTELGEIHFPNSGYREVDLALLAACNHSILSTGTFSWWGGYLHAAASHRREVTRYGGWPTPNSALAQMFNADDYFLPYWHSMD